MGETKIVMVEPMKIIVSLRLDVVSVCAKAQASGSVMTGAWSIPVSLMKLRVMTVPVMVEIRIAMALLMRGL